MSIRNSLEKGEKESDYNEKTEIVEDIDADVLKPNELTLHRGLQARQVSSQSPLVQIPF